MEVKITTRKPLKLHDTILYGACVDNHAQTIDYIYFKIPSCFGDYAQRGIEPFILAYLFKAMKRGWDIEVDEPVSEEFLRNMYEFQKVWNRWRPQYKIVAVKAPLTSARASPKSGSDAILTFSGGIDSLFSLWNHRKNPENLFPYPVNAAVFVHGFDIPLAKRRDYERTFQKLKLVTDSLGIPLIKVETNIKRFGHWLDIHGASLAACLHLLGKRFRYGIISNSFTYDKLIPWGSTPVTDPLLSSPALQIVHDGAYFSRSDKVQLLHRWDIVNNNLKVCFKRKDINCCTCEKCVRTILSYKANKLLPPKAFAKKVKLIHILQVVAVSKDKVEEYRSIYRLAKKNGIAETWVFVLKLSIIKNIFLTHIKTALFAENPTPKALKKMLVK